MEITLKQLAELTGSIVKGNASITLTGVAGLQDAVYGQISFVSNPKYKTLLNSTSASAVILSPGLAETYQGNVLINKDPYLTFAKVVKAFHTIKKAGTGVHSSAIIASDVILGENVSIGPKVVIEEGVNIGNHCEIGAGCFIGNNSLIDENVCLYPHVTIHSETRIGKRTVLHSGAVIGADGFGYALDSEDPEKSWFKILQIGNVVLGEDIEIGANTTIDRGALGSTEIRNGVKLDNQIQVGHNVCIEEHAIIAGATVIAGSTRIGKRCQIGGAVAIAGHLHIGDDVVLTGRSMVMASIQKPGVYSSGIALEENAKWRRNAARFRQLDAMARQIKHLETRLNELEPQESTNNPEDVKDK